MLKTMRTTRIGPSFLLCLLFCLLWGGCGGSLATGGTETGNTHTASLQVVGYQSSTLTGLGLQALRVNGITVNTARVVLDRIRFRPLSVCQGSSNGDDDIRLNGPFVVDLLKPQMISGLENITLPTGPYCRIELTLKKLDRNNRPVAVSSADPLVDRSVLIEGSRADGTPFQMTTEIDTEFKLENATTGFSISSSTAIAVFFIAFDLDQWFRGVDLSAPSVVVSTDTQGAPIILIRDDFNNEIHDRIEDNLKLSADLFKDNDNDENLDRGEHEKPLAAGAKFP